MISSPSLLYTQTHSDLSLWCTALIYTQTHTHTHTQHTHTHTGTKTGIYTIPLFHCRFQSSLNPVYTHTHTHTLSRSEGEMLQGRRGRGTGRDLNNLHSLSPSLIIFWRLSSSVSFEWERVSKMNHGKVTCDQSATMTKKQRAQSGRSLTHTISQRQVQH